MSAPAPSMFTEHALAAIDQLGLTKGRPNLEVFAETVLSLAREDRNVVVVTSDSRGSAKLVPFASELENQLIEVGIAEQNLVGVATGLASAGKTFFAVSPACFLTARALEQIKNDVAYSNHPVKLIGISAGVSYGALGSTHHSLHDLAALLAINNVDIVLPADNLETRGAILAAYQHPRPIYVRMGKFATYDLHPPDTPFELGKAIVAKQFNVPFYVAAPLSTIDINCKSGDDIPIEERSEDEVLYQTGIDEEGKLRKVLVSSPGSRARNPAFDVTPAQLISGIITEKGIVRAREEDIAKLFR